MGTENISIYLCINPSTVKTCLYVTIEKTMRSLPFFGVLYVFTILCKEIKTTINTLLVMHI